MTKKPRFIVRRVTWKGPLYLFCACDQCQIDGGAWTTDRGWALRLSREDALDYVTEVMPWRYFWDVRVDAA